MVLLASLKMVRSFDGVFTLKAAAQEAAEASLAKGEEASHLMWCKVSWEVDNRQQERSTI